jgi:hypothetical protein
MVFVVETLCLRKIGGDQRIILYRKNKIGRFFESPHANQNLDFAWPKIHNRRLVRFQRFGHYYFPKCQMP